MKRLEASLDWARDYPVDRIASAVQEIGFSCTRCGQCCSGAPAEPHAATVFPDEVRSIRDRTDRSWDDIARPMPFGVADGSGETFEWALQTDETGDCVFIEGEESHTRCSIYEDRPLLCRTYPFRLVLPGTGAPESTAVERFGRVEAYESPGLGAETTWEGAVAVAERLKERAIRELEETIALREQYRPRPDASGVVVHDAEGAKRPDGRPIGD